MSITGNSFVAGSLLIRLRSRDSILYDQGCQGRPKNSSDLHNQGYLEHDQGWQKKSSKLHDQGHLVQQYQQLVDRSSKTRPKHVTKVQFMPPSSIRFSQPEINTFFHVGKGFKGMSLNKLLGKLLQGKMHIGDEDLEFLACIERNGKVYTLNNRTLWVFREMERRGKCERVPVVFAVGYKDRTAFSRILNDGLSVRFKGSSVVWSWPRPDATTSLNPLAAPDHEPGRVNHGITADLNLSEQTTPCTNQNTMANDNRQSTRKLESVNEDRMMRQNWVLGQADIALTSDLISRRRRPNWVRSDEYYQNLSTRAECQRRKGGKMHKKALLIDESMASYRVAVVP